MIPAAVTGRDGANIDRTAAPDAGGSHCCSEMGCVPSTQVLARMGRFHRTGCGTCQRVEVTARGSSKRRCQPHSRLLTVVGA